jgi:hypothetical protein
MIVALGALARSERRLGLLSGKPHYISRVLSMESYEAQAVPDAQGTDGVGFKIITRAERPRPLASARGRALRPSRS